MRYMINNECVLLQIIKSIGVLFFCYFILFIFVDKRCANMTYAFLYSLSKSAKMEERKREIKKTKEKYKNKLANICAVDGKENN